MVVFCVGERRRLRDDAVPSVFPFKLEPSPAASMREQRAARRRLNLSLQTDDVEERPMEIAVDEVPVNMSSIDIAGEETIDDSQPVNSEIVEVEKTNCDVDIQCCLQYGNVLAIEKFVDNSRVISYYTGFKNYAQFMLVFNILGPCVYKLPLQCHLKPVDQFFLTLVKLRLATDDFELSVLFDVREKEVAKIFICWVNFLYYQLSEINFWPSRQVVQETMPLNFKKLFPNTRVIIDATEVPIQKPSHTNNQSASFSTYKNTNTLKVLVGCTPRGLISFISDAYCGSTSDRQICERSDLLKKPMFDSGDAIMADRGFNVQDLFANKNVHVNIPSFLKGKHQLGANEVVRDRRIASKRIHIERIIGLAKTFKILKQPLSAKRVYLGNRILKVCFLLCNFKTCIVGSSA